MGDDVAEYPIHRLFTGLHLQPTEVALKAQLPPEIIEAIIDEVASLKDEDTLKSCVQVAKSFVYPVQKHLFKSINLAPWAKRSGRRKAQKFWFHLLQSSPHIGGHVQELEIGGDKAFRCYLPEKCERSSWTTCTWILCAAANAVVLLPRVLPLLSNLRSFTFSFRSEDCRSWLEIPQASRSALEQLFQAGSLQTVKLGFITNLTSQACAGLLYIPDLILNNVTMAQEVAEEDIPCMYPATRQIKLRTLTLTSSSPSTVRALTRVLAASSSSTESFSKIFIKTLPVSDTTGFCNALEELITAAGNIRQFEWSLYDLFDSAPIDTRLFPHLGSLYAQSRYGSRQ